MAEAKLKEDAHEELRVKVEEERKLSVDMLTKKKQQNIGLENRCRELETERSKLQQLLTELNEGMESEREMSRVEDGTPVKSSPLRDFKAGLDSAKAENLAVLKMMSQDLDDATESLRVSRKEGQKWKKKMEEVMAREEVRVCLCL